jgi:hypothetical protein
MNIVNGAKLVIDIFGNAVRPRPDICSQVDVIIIDTAVENGDNDIVAALCLGPRL